MPYAGGEVRGEKYGLDIVLAVGRGINELTNRYVLWRHYVVIFLFSGYISLSLFLPEQQWDNHNVPAIILKGLLKIIIFPVIPQCYFRIGGFIIQWCHRKKMVNIWLVTITRCHFYTFNGYQYFLGLSFVDYFEFQNWKSKLNWIFLIYFLFTYWKFKIISSFKSMYSLQFIVNIFITVDNLKVNL